jgi:hypothetical protein
MTTPTQPPTQPPSHRCHMATQAPMQATRPLLLTLTVVLALAGCSSYPSRIDQQFGNTMRSLVRLQTVNPNAPVAASTLTLSDAQAAHAAVNRYQRSFEVPPAAANVFNIGVGSTPTGQAQ